MNGKMNQKLAMLTVFGPCACITGAILTIQMKREEPLPTTKQPQNPQEIIE